MATGIYLQHTNYTRDDGADGVLSSPCLFKGGIDSAENIVTELFYYRTTPP